MYQICKCLCMKYAYISIYMKYIQYICIDTLIIYTYFLVNVSNIPVKVWETQARTGCL